MAVSAKAQWHRQALLSPQGMATVVPAHFIFLHSPLSLFQAIHDLTSPSQQLPDAGHVEIPIMEIREGQPLARDHTAPKCQS